jgi:uncharacterized protein (DUF427 family)
VTLPDWALRARAKWADTGATRPPRAAEPEHGRESVWDYPRPPRIEPDSREITVANAAGQELARSRAALRVLETASPPTFYLPPTSVRWDRLAPAKGRSRCEWKGEAHYWRLAGDGSPQPVAWSYPRPFGEFERLRDHVGFYPGRVACLVAGERVRPQPGLVYGGWITSEITGPFKGEPGTDDW